MGTRVYQGAGGLRLHLDEPLSGEMAKQVSAGLLAPVGDEASEPESPTPADPDAPVEKPNANSKVDDWRAYAVSLGMPEEDAAAATKKELQEYVAVVEDADGSQE